MTFRPLIREATDANFSARDRTYTGQGMTDFRVSSNAELTAAVAAATGGDRILLAPGNYQELKIVGKSFASTVTIMSADISNQAHVDNMSIIGSSNITIQYMDVGRGLAAGEPDYTQITNFTDTSNILLNRLNLHGSLDGNPQNDGWLVYAANSKGFRISNSELQQAFRGVVFDGGTDIVVSNNKFHDIRSDASDYAAVQRVLIDGNTFGGYYPKAGDHPDAIQFWTAGKTVANTDIIIRNNIVTHPGGVGNQGIFMADEVGTLPYKNVTIENNFLYSNGSQWNGITVYHAENLNISNNTAITTRLDSMRFFLLVQDSTNVTLTKNVADQVVLQNNTNLTSIGNIDLNVQTSEYNRYPAIDKGFLATAADLVTPGVGYQMPASSAVGRALGDALSGLIFPSHGAAITAKAAVDDAAGAGTAITPEARPLLASIFTQNLALTGGSHDDLGLTAVQHPVSHRDLFEHRSYEYFSMI
jgi:hypothetical protein